MLTNCATCQFHIREFIIIRGELDSPKNFSNNTTKYQTQDLKLQYYTVNGLEGKDE